MIRRRPSEEKAARELGALGSPTRLRVFRLLVRAGPEGLNVGDLQGLTAVPASTLAHHLSTLARAGLVQQERRGREVICMASFPAMHALVAYLTDQCCKGVRLESEEDAA